MTCRYLRFLLLLLVFLFIVSHTHAYDTAPLIGIILGDTTHNLYATHLIAAGDNDLDGFSELLIDNGRRVYYLFKGAKPFDAQVDLRLFCLNPTGALVHDLNGDNQRDLIIGSGCSETKYKASVYFGGMLLDSIRDMWFGQDSIPATLHPAFAHDLNSDGTNELVFASGDAVVLFDLGPGSDTLPDLIFRQHEVSSNLSQNFGLFGCPVADFNGDGNDDLAISHTLSGLSQQNGRINFYWGGSGFDTVPDFTIIRRGSWSTSYNLFGSVLTCPGDLNGDGYPDIFVAGNGLDDTAWVYYGGPAIDDIPDVIIPTYLQNAGPAGDINRDGYDDLIASTYSQFSGHGAVFIWYGGPDFDSIPDVRIFNSDNQDYETYFGQSAIGIGDFNGDGVDDFAFSCYDLDTRGKIYVYSGTGIPDDVSDNADQLPDFITLHPNYPNPFNPTTTISFDLPRRTRVTLRVLNILGQEVASLVDEEMSAGSHSVEWGGRDASGEPVTSGVYLYRLETGEGMLSRKMLLLK